MEAKYLMIGDWLSYDGTPCQFIYSRKVGRICFQMNPHLKIDVPETDLLLKPIPLTREILEKNGFEYCEAHRIYLYLDDFFDIKIRQYSDMMWEFTYCNNEMNLPDTQIAGIGYVHHLQHALNMVGVEKDIII